MGNYDGIGKAQVFEGGVYFQPGLFLVRVDVVKESKTRKGREFFVVECTILDSNHPELVAGKTVAQLIMLDQDAALSNIKQFAMVAGECSAEEVDGKSIQMMISQENPLQGTVLGVEATNVLTREKKDFTRIKWLSEADGREKLAAYKAVKGSSVAA